MTTDSAIQEIDRLQKIFEARKADLRCPVCQTETQMVMSGGSINAGIVYDSITPTVVVACRNCGLVRHFIEEFLMHEPEPQDVS
jgi:uncharacterized Zn finger protein